MKTICSPRKTLFITIGKMKRDITVSIDFYLYLTNLAALSSYLLVCSVLFDLFFGDNFTVYHFGEVLQGRYEITARRGKGVFSTVVNAKDLKAQKDGCGEVAIKIICNNIEK